MKLIIFGVQGSGKSTQAQLLSKDLRIPYVATGDLVRSEAESGSITGKKIGQMIGSGQLAPTEFVVAVLKKRLTRKDCRDGYIIDGFPRNLDQYNSFSPEADRVIYIKISDEEAKERLLKRGRGDDTEEAIEKRINIYHQETEPLLEIFRQKGILEEVDGEKPIEAVHQDLAERIKTK